MSKPRGITSLITLLVSFVSGAAPAAEPASPDTATIVPPANGHISTRSTGPSADNGEKLASVKFEAKDESQKLTLHVRVGQIVLGREFRSGGPLAMDKPTRIQSNTELVGSYHSHKIAGEWGMGIFIVSF